jgi:GNAT superfamily N-acetyltransferase
MEISLVGNKKQLNEFINLPYLIYKNDPNWVAPLRSEAQGQFDSKKNPLLDHCDYALFLFLDNNKVIGRIAAFVDTLAVDYWHEKIGLFGYYECPDDPAASKMLLDTAVQWLREKGMTSMRGPWSFVSQEWGSVVEGFSPEPVVMSPYNPPYYNHQFEEFGLAKVKDLLVYYIDAREGYQIPERILTLTDRVANRYGIHVRQLDVKNFDREVQTVIELSNESLAINWGYSPVTEDEVKAMARDLKPVIHPKAVLFAEDNQGRPIGFAIAIPDVNQLIKGLNGRMLPFGIFKLLFGLPKLTQYRMFALGVIPEYHGKGVDSLIYRALYESCYSQTVRMEINYVLEDNYPMNNAIIKLGAKPLRRYRVYEMPI